MADKWYEHVITVTATVRVWDRARDQATSVANVRAMDGDAIKACSNYANLLTRVTSVVVDSTVEQTNHLEN